MSATTTWYKSHILWIGLLSITISLAINTHHPSSFWLAFISNALQTAGLTCCIYVFFNITIDTKNWQDYFRERLKEIIIGNEYLKKLDRENLFNLRLEIYKVIFKTNQITESDSFFNYYNKNIFPIMNSPYRHDTRVNIRFDESEKHYLFRVHDKASYECKSFGGKIQERILWAADPDEFDSIESITFKISDNKSTESAGDFVVLREWKKEEIDRSPDKRFEYLLSDFSNRESFTVEVSAVYHIKKCRFQIWKMSYPTQKFTMSVRYPEKYTLQSELLSFSRQHASKTEDPGYFEIKYDSWMLPQSGIVWQLFPPREHCCATSPEQEESPLTIPAAEDPQSVQI